MLIYKAILVKVILKSSEQLKSGATSIRNPQLIRS